MHIINRQMVALVTGLLSTDIPETYYYHNFAHTQNVMRYVEVIGHAENCSTTEIRLLLTAALWHDTGYINIYKGHEAESCILAEKHLPVFGYPTAEIKKIIGMIMATKTPQSPKNRLEQIIADADLAYLGSDDVTLLANNLYRELHELNPLLTKQMWNTTEINFLQNHQYFTLYCKLHTQPGKLRYLKRLLLTRQ